MDVIRPQILIISNKFDFGTDHVTYRLKEMEASYWRLNRDQLPSYQVSYNPKKVELTLNQDQVTVILSSETLKSIYYRAPTFLRETFQNADFSEQLESSQWAAFVRALAVFRKVKWMNNPVSTYFAEMKPVQLSIANELGFKIPETLIGNISDSRLVAGIPGDEVVIKTVDTGYVTGESQDGFIYTNFVNKNLLNRENTHSIPFILQEALVPKIDIRVTAINNKLFPISICSEKPIDGDWRLKKNNLLYELVHLPDDISEKCTRLLVELQLNFGGIDLVYHNGDYYFIEINPTGEWDWLMHHTSCPIDKEIAEELLRV